MDKPKKPGKTGTAHVQIGRFLRSVEPPVQLVFNEIFLG
jgi:hypothetical protein